MVENGRHFGNGENVQAQVPGKLRRCRKDSVLEDNALGNVVAATVGADRNKYIIYLESLKASWPKKKESLSLL